MSVNPLSTPYDFEILSEEDRRRETEHRRANIARLIAERKKRKEKNRIKEARGESGGEEDV